MKRSPIKTDPLDEEIEAEETRNQQLDPNPKSRKRRPKRDGCLAGNPSTPRTGKPKTRPGAPEAGAAAGAAAAAVPAGNPTTGPYGETAIALHEINKNAKVSAKDVERHPRTSRDELTYRQVVGKKAAQKIGTNQTVKKGMVK